MSYKVHRKANIFYLVIISLMSFGTGIFSTLIIENAFKSPVTTKRANITYTITPIEKMQPTLQNCKFWLYFFNVKYPAIAYRQIQLESGNLTSRVAKVNNNLFGMRLAKRRNTTAVGEHYGFAYYTDFIQSIADYKLYQEFIKVPNGLSDLQYCLFLQDHKYWEDSTYIQKLLTK